MSPFAWGGSEELWSRSALELKRCGHRVATSVKEWPQPAESIQKLSAAGVAIRYRKPLDLSLPSRLWRKLQGFSPSGEVTDKISRWLVALQPDLVCLSLANSQDGLEYVRVCRDSGIPYVVIIHGVYDSHWATDAVANEMAQLFSTARRCFFVSQSNRILCEEQIGTTLPNSEVVRNPFNVSHDVALPWPETSPCWRVASVGRLEPHTKGQDILLKVLATDKWKNRNITVSFYGSGEHFGGVVRKLASRYAPVRVEFPGHVENVEEIWRTNHALVMPSRCEGMPLALVEAMCCARIGIVTNVGGHAELVKNGINGFLAAAPTVELFDEALEEAWGCRQDWKDMGAEARRTIETLFPANPATVFARRLETLVKSPA